MMGRGILTGTTRTIVDDDLLAEQFAHLGHNQARDQIDAATRRERHDDAQRLRRKIISLRCGSAGKR